MPTTYTHCRFGRQVLSLLPRDLQRRIQPHQDLYMIGLHGPDIFFYYDPFRKNPVGNIGSAMHTLSGETVFSRFARLDDGSDAAYAYLMGFLCHFALDAFCHGYINAQVPKGIGHNLLEIELDRSFLLEDCLDPMTHDPVSHLHPTRACARTIARFFPQSNEEEILKTLLRQKTYLRLLTPGSAPKRLVLEKAVKALHAQHTFGELVLQPEPVARCQPAVMHLRKLCRQCLPLAVAMICDWPARTNDRYRWNFNGEET